MLSIVKFTEVTVFQSRTGSTGHLALFGHELLCHCVQFQSRTGSTGHLACHPSSIAQEALVCKRLRGTLYRRVFSTEREQHFWPLFSSIRSWRLARGYAQ